MDIIDNTGCSIYKWSCRMTSIGWCSIPSMINSLECMKGTAHLFRRHNITTSINIVFLMWSIDAFHSSNVYSHKQSLCIANKCNDTTGRLKIDRVWDLQWCFSNDRTSMCSNWSELSLVFCLYLKGNFSSLRDLNMSSSLIHILDRVMMIERCRKILAYSCILALMYWILYCSKLSMTNILLRWCMSCMSNHTSGIKVKTSHHNISSCMYICRCCRYELMGMLNILLDGCMLHNCKRMECIMWYRGCRSILANSHTFESLHSLLCALLIHMPNK